jgi:hypothetical protein
MVEQQTEGPQIPEQSRAWHLKLISNKRLLLSVIVLIIVIAATAGWYFFGSEVKTGWTEYRSEKYGLKFTYPSRWGNVIVTESKTSDVFPEFKQTGKSYEISFSQFQKTDKRVAITLQSDDFTTTFCAKPEQCITNKGFSKTEIQTRLTSNNPSFLPLVGQDSNSYATVVSSQAPNNQKFYSNTLNFYQAIGLKKINVSAINIGYTTSSTTSCANDKLTSDNSSGCITQTIYNDLKQIAKSFQSI